MRGSSKKMRGSASAIRPTWGAVLVQCAGGVGSILGGQCADDLCDEVVDDVIDDVALVLEVPVEGPMADSESCCDVGNSGCVIAALGEALE